MEETLHGVYTTASTISQLLVCMVAVMFSEPDHKGVGYDNFLGHIAYLQQ